MMKQGNNTVLITGGTSGIGYEFAKQLLALGNTVIVTGRNQQRLDETKKQLPGIYTFQSDVSDPKAIAILYKAITAQFPGLNILVNNAGEMRKLNLLDSSIDQINVNREIDINLSGPIRMIQQFLPQLLAKNPAAIMNVTSGLAFVSFPLAPVYSATKSGLHAYTQCLRVQLKKTSIKVFELAAPATSTPLIDNFGSDMSSGMLMQPSKLVAAAIKGMNHNTYEILPGVSRLLKYMSRIAPGLIFAQMSKLAEKSFAVQPGISK